MALKVELKPGERILIGESVITNGDQRARFLIDGTAPILRERDRQCERDRKSRAARAARKKAEGK